MKAKLHLVCSITIFFSFFSLSAQQEYWSEITGSGLKSSSLGTIKSNNQVFQLNALGFEKELNKEDSLKSSSQTIYLPHASGKLIPFKMRKKSVLHPDLAKKFPDIKSYVGESLDGKYRVRLSSSHKGLQSMIVQLDGHEASFMEPTSDQKGSYVVYEKHSSEKTVFVCGTEKLKQEVQKTLNPLVDDQVLRTFRIAVSTTGEYTDYHGGTVADALAAINATLTRVNEVFERDLGATLELVPNNDLVIFTDGTTDPYNGNLNAQTQSTLSSIIGEANYDVGHLFARAQQGQDNGNAGFIGSVCQDNRKGSAFASGFIPEGDVFDLDFVAHELGHQFGANHTWSFETEGTGVQAEPASGTTIMGYAGIVPGNDVQPNGDDYFHYNSIVQIRNYLGTVSCGTPSILSNTPPTVTPIGDFVIPKGTAFVLEGVASDADPGDVLTYTWEQINDGVVTTSTFGPENPVGANFRSLPPSTDPARYFPRLSRVLQGNLTQTSPPENGAWETVSNIQRDLSFALTVRDNASGGGQVISDILDVQVINSAGPFSVTSQASNVTYQAGTAQTVVWDVANTDALPINAQTVDIFLSTDGGNTFPITLVENTLNDGSEEVLLPGNATTAARIMIKAHDNIFFAVNSSNFTLEATDVALDFETLSFEVCEPNNLIIPFAYETFNGFSETSTFSADVPAGMSALFSPSQSSTNTSADLTLSGTNAVAPGEYTIPVRAVSASQTTEVELKVSVLTSTFSDVTLLAPTDAASNVSLGVVLNWQADVNNSSYDIEIATDIGFSNIVESENTLLNTYKPNTLLPETTYFWRVRPQNSCGQGTFSTPFSFTTINIDCQTKETTDTPISISQAGVSTRTATIQFIEGLPIADVNVELVIDHTYVGDLIVTLISPTGTRVALLANTCGDLNNINATFDDDGVEITCSGNPVISGTVAPISSLSAFIGESPMGEWTLEVRDTAPGDGGVIQSFSLEICVEGSFRPDDDEDGVFDDGDDLCLGTPKGVEVDTSGCPVNRLPANNFLVEINSESCRNNNDGSVEIQAANMALAYTAILDDGVTPLNANFTSSGLFENLSAGTYSLCISATDGTITYQETCFDIILTEPEPLSVVSLVEDSIASLTMTGGTLYNVELNGLVTQTEDSQIQLDLKNGLNTLRVFTNLPCQGTYTKTFIVGTVGILYPNPVGSETKLFLNELTGSVNIQVYSNTGRLVMVDTKTISGSEVLMDFSSLSTGAYILRIEGDGFKDVFKMIKQ
ncbi:reprolysin-like metallopeptidase [Flagellimonas sp.]|uniref:reprolysin-like metallopeptidase n=1 Tax=Flagellimonas sp. TaxID=2058762 RepID=UPI003F4A5EA4